MNQEDKMNETTEKESNYERIAKHLVRWANLKTVAEASSELGISHGSLSGALHTLNKRVVSAGGTPLTYYTETCLDRAVKIILTGTPNRNVQPADTLMDESLDVEA